MELFSSSSSESDSDNEYYVIREPKVYKNRITNFDTWNDNEFYQRFRLSKAAIYELLDHIHGRICSVSNRCVIKYQ
jgi:hypothetical protein